MRKTKKKGKEKFSIDSFDEECSIGSKESQESESDSNEIEVSLTLK